MRIVGTSLAVAGLASLLLSAVVTVPVKKIEQVTSIWNTTLVR